MSLRGFVRKLFGAGGPAPAPGGGPKVVVFYDCENVGPACFGAVTDLARGEGDLVGTRLYGPAALLGCRSWRSLADGGAVQLVACDGSRAGKNSADITLAVDAVDMAKDAAFDTCVLVSSDSDYAPLVRKLRNLGVRVCGAGGVGSKATYAPECDSWTVLETSKPLPVPKGSWAKHAGNWKLLDLLENAVTSTAEDDGWSELGMVGQRVKELDPAFDVSDCGCSSLKALLREVGEYDLLQRDGACLVRLRRLPGQV